MGKGNLMRNLAIIAVLVVIILILAYGALKYSKNWKSNVELYFNDASDLPDLTKERSILHPGEDYEILFTIENNDDNSDYRLVIDSNIYNLEQDFSLEAGEEKTFSLLINVDEDQKWALDYTTEESWKDEIDITDNSWLGERNDFNIIIDGESMPSIADYYLPVSNEITNFGSVYHVDLSLDEIKRKGFVKDYSSIESEEIVDDENNLVGLKKIVSEDHIELYVEDDKLVLEAERSTTAYVLEKDRFSVRVYDEGDKVSEITFSYQIR